MTQNIYKLNYVEMNKAQKLPQKAQSIEKHCIKNKFEEKPPSYSHF